MAETATRKVIREACAAHLGLLLDVAGVAKVDERAYTISPLADVSPDAERMRDSFLYDSVGEEFRRILHFGYPENNDVDISRAFDYNAGTNTGADDTTLTDTSQAWVPDALIGLVVTCNSKTMTITDNTATVLTGTGWSGGGNPGSPYAYTISEPSAHQIYFMLTPDEWNTIIDETLPEFFYKDRDKVTIVANTLEYTLSTWIQTAGQIINIFYEHQTTKVPQPIGTYTLKEDANALKLQLLAYPPSSGTYDIIVEARHNYAALANDAATTTGPRPLWFHGVVVGAAQRIFRKYGQNIKRLFGQTVVLAERDLAAAKARVLPPLVARELTADFAWEGVDVDSFLDNVSW